MLNHIFYTLYVPNFNNLNKELCQQPLSKDPKNRVRIEREWKERIFSCPISMKVGAAG